MNSETILYELLPLYILIACAAAFTMMGVDKRRAVKGRRRISEAALIWAAVLGGSPGEIAGMLFFHHKTRHAKFTVGVPLILAAQTALLLLLYRAGRG